MALITWDDSYSVKVKQMDEQHKKLIDLINQLHDAMKIGKGKDVAGEVMNSLINYTNIHFGAEERLMAMHNYPGYEEQKSAHAALIKRVEEMAHQFKTGKAPLTQDIMAFLKDWLIKHIQDTDQKYGAFFTHKGVI